MTRLGCMLEDGLLTRFGPMFHAEHLGGAVSLCAMRVPPERFEAVAAQVNAYPEVAHNYQRDHAMNMWFVLATETPQALQATLARIEAETGLRVFNLPKREEFYVGLHFHV
jgi:DNA-binding Lrp family transcriptional regulator